jgi:hydrogenase nickel incorporation protein HypA/HybF
VPLGIKVSCLACGSHTDVDANRLVCGHCGGFRTRVIRGDELRLRRIEMRTAVKQEEFVPCVRPAVAP